MQKYANLVELEKCCQKNIFLQNFVLIQPRTSPAKICKILLIFPILLTLTLTEVREPRRGSPEAQRGGAREPPDAPGAHGAPGDRSPGAESLLHEQKKKEAKLAFFCTFFCKFLAGSFSAVSKPKFAKNICSL